LLPQLILHIVVDLKMQLFVPLRVLATTLIRLGLVLFCTELQDAVRVLLSDRTLIWQILGLKHDADQRAAMLWLSFGRHGGGPVYALCVIDGGRI
jgi:hypothetical protein